MHAYDVVREIERRAVRQWAAVGTSSVYQALERLAADGLLRRAPERVGGQGPGRRTVYALTAAGHRQLRALARSTLASEDHQRFDFDLGVGVALTHLPLAEVREALERRRDALRARTERAAADCEWAARMLGAWAVLDHQRRALAAEVEWLDAVIARIAADATASPASAAPPAPDAAAGEVDTSSTTPTTVSEESP